LFKDLESLATPSGKTFAPAHPSKEGGTRTFEMEWPELHPRQKTFALNQGLKGLEDRIFREAKERALAIEKEAYEKGFAQGEKDGIDLGLKRLETILQHFQKILEEIQNQKKILWAQHERDLVRLVGTILRKILRREIPCPEEVITHTLREALHLAAECKPIQVHLHPQDHDYLMGQPGQPALPMGGKDSGEIRFLSDPAIHRGGCFLETAYGDIDATMEGQLEEILATFWERFQKAGSLPEGSEP
jgi:flagellar assembly protein FliH